MGNVALHVALNYVMRNAAPLLVIGCHNKTRALSPRNEGGGKKAFAGVMLCHFTADARKYVP